MIIISISGKKRSGKDTVASFIQEWLILNKYSRPVFKRAWADALKEEVAIAFGVTVQFIEEHKEEFRAILQWWGTDSRRKFKGDRYWIDKMCKNLQELPRKSLVIIPDTRFPNEIEAVNLAEGFTIRVVRDFPVTLKPVDLHVSETALDNYQHWSIVINNNGSLESTRAKMFEYMNLIFKNLEL